MALPLLLAALTLSQSSPIEPPGSIVATAVRAVEGDSVEALERRWSRRATGAAADHAARFGLATLARLTYRYERSDSLYLALVPPGATATNPYARAALLGLGESQAARGLPQLAAESYARAARQAGDNRADRAAALLGLADALSRTQRDADADSLLLLIDELIPSGDPAVDAEYHCARAGPPILSGELEEGAEAMTGVRLALAAGNRRLESRCLLGVAKAHYRLRQQDSALAYGEAAARLAGSARDRSGLATIRQWQGYSRLTAGDYAGAWHQLHHAQTLSQETGNLGAGGLSAMYLASLALRFGDPELALQEAVVAESLLTESGNRRTLGSLLAIRADIARAMGDTARARAMYLDLIARQGPFGGFGAVAPYRSLATMARQRGDWSQAESLLATAQSQATVQGMQEWNQRLAYDRGAVALARNDERRATRNFMEFLGGLTPAQQARGYAARVRLAELAARRGSLDEAEEWLTAAADSLDGLRARLDVPALRLQSFQIRDDEADPDLGFAGVIAALAAGGRLEPAFGLVERRRGRELADQLQRGLALRRAAIDTLAPGRPEPVSLSQLQRELGPTTALLSFVTGRGGEPTTLFLVRSDTLVAFALPAVDSLTAGIEGLVRSIESGALDTKLASRLGALLLGVAVRVLPSETTQLIIVPDAGLHRLPFEVLGLEGGGAVLDRFITAQLPSAMALVRLRRLGQRNGEGILAFGDPSRSRSEAAELRTTLGGVGELKPLPAARKEAREVARFAPTGSALVGGAATESAFKRMARGKQTLHFAVHAVVNEMALTRTALVLAPSTEDDGIVEPGEITSLSLDADLVVLSACRSASGVALAGEGIRGLTAPFLESGARSVVGSTWAVADQGARTLVREFYLGLAEGLTVGGALRKARLEARREGLAPELWAGFVLTGDPEVRLPLSRPARRWLWWVAAIALTLASGGWWFSRRAAPRGSR